MLRLSVKPRIQTEHGMYPALVVRVAWVAIEAYHNNVKFACNDLHEDKVTTGDSAVLS